MSNTNNIKRNALGRGLGALLKDADSVKSKNTTETTAAVASNLNEIPVEQIEVNSYQPRSHFNDEALKELSESIKIQGIIQPITVRQLAPNQYQLISGERRLRASKLAGLTNIPAYIRTANDQQMLEMALIENIQRENLNPIEIAISYQRMITECNLKQEELGDRVGKNRSTVTNYVRLLKLPPDIQVALRDNEISMGHARSIISLEKIEQQLYVLNKIKSEELSVRAVEELVRNLQNNKPASADTKGTPAKPAAAANAEISSLQNKLTSHFGTKIQVKSDKQFKGEIKIPFVSAEDLNRILEILNF
ncbi:ParB/RepB/Spo0J family partition protein [Cytophaga hutchinsonii]|uniref:Chromosome partitioning protein n=1 Tax=Cytophaga hutchinsonii (strain ATCC 33406 / DSM 1761 / CIP 103989 / NBRC 15051 / NCIMB 9469 / D465) TaxID=269798 RepID=A0A6N4STN4_CYTH3|nr:ParB/RepB/Spo0J family partition protein [Cytophaga hutchinsonii]ABG59814.1 chromosome partitioning protein [Cytophaga hutchinsonii ATCC 33406]SFX29371.1 chromosome partitioning protein, ParB family [Cytophaga hutchinsonii ATCC 33406]